LRSCRRCARPLRLWGRWLGLGFGCRRVEQPTRELRIRAADDSAPELRRLDATAERWRLNATAATASSSATPAAAAGHGQCEANLDRADHEQ